MCMHVFFGLISTSGPECGHGTRLRPVGHAAALTGGLG